MRRAMSLSFLLALALVFATGCAKKKATTKEPEPTPAPAEAPAEAAQPAEEPPAEQPAAEEPPMEEPPAEAIPEEVPAAEPPAQEEPPPREPTMEEIDAARGASGERAEKLKESLRGVAERARRAGDLEQAREAYRKILLLDPTDTEARDAFNRLSVELGDRGPAAAEVIEGAGALEAARREQAKMEISRRLGMARQAEDEADYAKAIRMYEEILNILNWYPYQAEFPITSEKARSMLESARQRKTLQERREAEEMARRTQDEEERLKDQKRDDDLQRMRIYLKLADEAYEKGDYILAEQHARQVLALDPDNESARELARVAKESQYTSSRAELRERFSDQWRLTMERLELDALPQIDVVRFPERWETISQRRPPRTGAATEVAVDPRTERILNVLNTKRVYDLAFKENDITLDGVRSYLASVTGENFVLSNKVNEEKKDVGIVLQVTDVSVTQVLNLITEQYEMAWKIRNGVVMIVSADEAAEKPVLQFYDVKDLVAKISDFPGQEINLVPSKYQPPEAEEDREPVSPFEVDQLIDVIKTTIEPETWEKIEGAGIDNKNNVLVVRTSPNVHQKIAQLLHDLRKNTGLLVSMEVRFLTAEDRFLRDIGVDVRGLGDQTGGVGLPGLGTKPGRDPLTNFDDSFTGSTANPSGSPLGTIPEPSSIGTARNPGIFYGDGQDGEYKGRIENLFDFILGFDEPGRAVATAQNANVGANSGGFTLQHTFLDDTQFEVILRAVEKSERIEQINAPRLTVYDTQRANVSVLRQNSYVQDFDVEIAQAAAIGDPIIQTIRDGIILDVRPIVSADRRFITMELRPTVAELVRPIPTFSTSLATGPPVTIQVPEISISRVRTTVTMPDGGVLLLGGIKFFRDIVADSGLPILNKVPILSFLFGRKAKSVQRRNLLILIRAEVQVLDEQAPVFSGVK